MDEAKTVTDALGALEAHKWTAQVHVASRAGQSPAAETIGANSARAAEPGRVSAKQQFEAFFLQSMLGHMMPDERNAMFGTGSAGRMWRSLLVEQIAAQIAQSGRLELLSSTDFERSISPGDGSPTAPVPGPRSAINPGSRGDQ